MRRRDRRHVENFAVCGEPAMEIVAIPGGEPDGAVAAILFRDVQSTPNRIWPADAIGAAALRHRVAELDHARTGRDAILRVKLVGELAGGPAVGERQASCGSGYKSCRAAKLLAPMKPHAPPSTQLWPSACTTFLPKPQGHPHPLRYNLIVARRRRKWGIPLRR